MRQATVHLSAGLRQAQYGVVGSNAGEEKGRLWGSVQNALLFVLFVVVVYAQYNTYVMLCGGESPGGWREQDRACTYHYAPPPPTGMIPY